MPGIFEPFKIGGLELRNHFVRSATWDATADAQGRVTDNSVALYSALGEGGVGLIVTGYAFVTVMGQAAAGQYGVHRDEMIPGLRKLVQAAHKGGAKIVLQIVHSGINSPYLWQKGLATMAVSPDPEVKRPHNEMSAEDIESIIAAFAAAAVRARKAGFDGVQLHGAHGYLMSQFLSPLTNKRADQWGGSSENRRRFHIEVVRRVRKAAGDDYPFMIKFGVMDDRPNGLTLAEGVQAAQQMVAAGLDAIEVSAGIGQSIQAVKEGEAERAYFRERGAAVKKAVPIPVILVGGIRTPGMAQAIIDSGDADLISMSRPLIREPALIARWQKGNTAPALCISCGRCMGIARRGEPLQCGEGRRLREGAGA